MDNFPRALGFLIIKRNARLRQHKMKQQRKRRLIIKNYMKTIKNLIDSYVRAIAVYLPPQKSLKAHYRAPEVGEDLKKLDDKRFYGEFRISKNNFEYICCALRLDLEAKPNPVSGSNKKQATLEEKVAVCLYKLKSCCEYQVVGNVFGFGKSTVQKYFYQVIKAIIKNLTPLHIKMPTSEEARFISGEFQKITQISQILGAIDCTHIPVTAPLEGARDYLNRKGWTSIVLQAVVDHSYKFLDISCNFPGNVHDAVVLKGSQLYRCQNNLFPNSNYNIGNVNIPYLLLGDPAYPLIPWIMKDFPGTNLDPKKQMFNVKLNRGRVKVEQTFGILKNCWRILSRRSEIDINFMPFVVAACCTLHNIIREELIPHMQTDHLNVNESIQPSDEIDSQLTELTSPSAGAIRNAIANKLYEDNTML